MGRECFIRLVTLPLPFKYFTISLCYLDDKKGIKNKGQLGTAKSLGVDLLGCLQSNLYGIQSHGCTQAHRCVCTGGSELPSTRQVYNRLFLQAKQKKLPTSQRTISPSSLCWRDLGSLGME